MMIRYLCARIGSACRDESAPYLVILKDDAEFQALQTYPDEALARNHDWLDVAADIVWSQPPGEATRNLGQFLAEHAHASWAWNKIWSFWAAWDNELAPTDFRLANSMRILVHELQLAAPRSRYANEIHTRIVATDRYEKLHKAANFIYEPPTKLAADAGFPEHLLDAPADQH